MLPLHLRVAAIAAMVLSCVAPASASSVDLFGYGMRGVAMAGAVTSSARGHAAVYYNPAGLGLDHQRTFAVGFQMGHFDLSMDGAPRDARDAPAVVIGFGVPVPFGGPMADRITLGLGFVIPQTSVLIADIPRPGEPSFPLLDNRAQTVSIQGAVGVRLLDELSLGVGFLALSELDGGIVVEPNDAGQIGSRVKSQLVASWTLVAGLEAHPLPWLAVGLTYRSESVARFRYPMQVDLGDAFDLPIPSLDVAGIAQYDPAQAAVEVSALALPWLRVSLAGFFKRWSAFANPIAFTAVPPGYPAQPPPAFSDIFGGRLGLEAGWSEDDWTVIGRLGLAYEPSPAPEQRGFHNYLDNDRVIIGLGVEGRWRMLSLALAGQLHHLLERTSVKDPDRVAADAPGAPSITHGGLAGVWGVELGVVF
jgi:long-chain fatty acid transport protein